MNVFLDLEGLDGEELGSAGLRHLMLRSLPVRTAILHLLSKNSPVGPLLSDSYFACSREKPTIDEEAGRGRLDLAIEVDNAVVGIESKFLASFTKDQPAKYLSTVDEMAASLSKMRGKPVRACIFVLGPRSRAAEMRREIQPGDRTCFVAWEDVLDALAATLSEVDALSAGLLRDFSFFVRRYLVFLPDFDMKLPHLLREFPDGGTELQFEYMQALAKVIRVDGKLNAKSTWCGYYLTKDSLGVAQTWLGFERAGAGEGRDGEPAGLPARFVISRKPPRPVTPDPRYFTPMQPNTSFLCANKRWEMGALQWSIKLKVDSLAKTPVPSSPC